MEIPHLGKYDFFLHQPMTPGQLKERLDMLHQSMPPRQLKERIEKGFKTLQPMFSCNKLLGASYCRATGLNQIHGLNLITSHLLYWI
jgi:hypothetical protein